MSRTASTLSLGLLAAALAAPPAAAEEARLLRQPSVSEHHIAFAYANDIWIVDRGGGEARRLTTFPGGETQPHLSPDGRLIAFTGVYDGNTDVYVVAIEGGDPRRLTWHPGADDVRGWSADGRRVIFSSGRTGAPLPISKFWTIELDGTLPEPLPIPRVFNGKFDDDETRFAYQPIELWDIEWRNYRGGQTRPIWLVDMDDLALETLPWDGSNDTDPVWIGDTIYFLSDRDLAVNIWSYDTKTKRLRQVTRFDEYDAKNLEAGGGVLVFECGGYLHTYDPDSGDLEQVHVEIRADLSWARPQWVTPDLRNGALSPTGVRAVFEGRGDIFTVPAKDGDVRNLTRSAGVADRSPVWSPDGRHVAWFSDASGEYQLMVGEQKGLKAPRAIDLNEPTFYFTPAWSPDSTKILFTDEGLNLSYVDIESGEQTHVDTDQFAHPQRTVNPVWSPDSNWIAYAKRLDSQYHAIMVHHVESGETHQLTDGMSDAISPAWDRNGKYLYFLASTNFALNTGWLDMSSYERPVQRAIYFAVLQADEPSPLLPKSDEEEIGEEGDEETERQRDEVGEEEEEEEEEKEKPDDLVRIDFEGIQNRILALPVGSGEYTSVRAGPKGTVFYMQEGSLSKFDMASRKSSPFASGVGSYSVSADGKKMLYSSGGSWHIVGTGGPAKAGDGRLSTSSIRMKVDPRTEWRQIFREAWRYQRDFLYVENVHGADWDAVWDRYEPWLEHVGHRSDLNYLLDILGGEVAVGHSFVGGGDTPDVTRVPVGLLGADLEPHDGRYRLARIYSGENWNPNLRAPLAAPGIDIEEGEYVLAVNGVDLTTDVNPYSLFERTAGRQTVLRVASGSDDEEDREVTVVPVGSEVGLRQRAWIEDNRRRVDEMSDGRLAYVWLPDTGFGGYTNFNRYYFAQQHKQGAVIDERYNGGGSAADYMVDIMSRRLHGFFNNPVAEKKPFTSPGAGIWGPKVMVINEWAGSGGDYLPYMFRQMGIGPLVGTRTWGGLVGIWDVPPLIDNGRITAPRGGFYDLEGKWAVENEGVAPDIEVEQTPAEVHAGGDPQLERAVAECLRLLEETPPAKILPQPPDPVRAVRPKR